MHRAVLPPFPKSTLSELKSIGMYSKFNPKLKKEIDSYYVSMENDFNGNLNYWRWIFKHHWQKKVLLQPILIN